jgi:hypothetical protein
LYGEICTKDYYTHQEYCAADNLVFSILWHIREILDSYAATIEAMATIAIAGFTFTLWRATTEHSRITDGILKLSRDELISSNRPWVMAEKIEHLEPFPNMETYCRIGYKVNILEIAEFPSQSPSSLILGL